MFRLTESIWVNPAYVESVRVDGGWIIVATAGGQGFTVDAGGADPVAVAQGMVDALSSAVAPVTDAGDA